MMGPAVTQADPADSHRPLARLGFADGWRFLLRIVLLPWVKGVLVRRPAAVALAERWDLDRKAVRFMQQLRRKYGEGPLLWRTAARSYAIVLSDIDVKRVLDGAPDPFTPASSEKRAALAHFEPHGSLIARGRKRQSRRQFNDDLLESAKPIHRLGERFAGIVRDEAARLFGSLRSGQQLTWPKFTDAWFNVARQIVLGEHARDDRTLTDELYRLRAEANWVFFRPVRTGLRSRYYARLAAHLARAEPGSLAEMIARRTPHGDEQPADQITQWLFAFDGGGITAFRALALFVTHPDQASHCATDLAAWRAGEYDLPYLRAGFVEAVRLWPTTPAILRETTAATAWDGASMPKGAGIIIYAPFLHRDDERRADADRFKPQAWLGQDPADAAPLVPFSAGPAACPGRHLVSLIGSAWLAALLDGRKLELANPKKFGPSAPLPGTLDHFSIRFSIRREQEL
jgi:cytochrome P450